MVPFANSVHLDQTADNGLSDPQYVLFHITEVLHLK